MSLLPSAISVIVFFYSCSIMIAGTFPVVALMTGDAITRLTHELSMCAEVDNVNGTNGTNGTMVMGTDVSSDPCAHSDCEQYQVDIAVTLSSLVGLLMVNVLRLSLSLSLSLSHTHTQHTYTH